MSDEEPCFSSVGVFGDRTCPALATHVHCVRCPTFAETAHELFERPPPPGYRAEWTEQLATSESDAIEAAATFVTFRVGDEWFGLPSSICVEVTDAKKPFPLAHRVGGAFEGFVNVRGQIVLSVSLGALLALSGSATQSSRARILVVEDASGRYALRVDELDRVRRVALSAMREPPATVVRALSSHVRALVLGDAADDHGFAVLDETSLFDALARCVS